MLRAIEIFLIIYGAVSLISLFAGSNYGRDDSDPPGSRSGLGVFVDHRTGCHYLSRPFGGLTPRLGRDGKQICDAGKSEQEVRAFLEGSGE